MTCEGRGGASTLGEDARPATATAAHLLNMIGASWMSQAICVAAELELPELLARGPRTLHDLAIAAGCAPDSLFRLLRALASLGICAEEQDGTFALTSTGTLLLKDAPLSVRSWAIWWGRHLWPIWHDLRSSVRTGKSARELAGGRKGYAHLEADPELALLFNRAMAELTGIVAMQALRVYDFSGATRLVDVGGGYGELLKAILAALPGRRGVIFDRPQAIEGAKALLADDELSSRIELLAGDFFEAVPGGGDLYLLKSILHNWDDERASVILRNCRAAMSAHSKLVLIERVMPERMQASLRAQALARTDLNMMVGLGGRERTAAEISRLLVASDLTALTFLPLHHEHTLIEARPASA